MDTFLQALGIGTLALLAVIGLIVGVIAGALLGRRKLVYGIAGAVGAVVLPFVLAALGVTVLAGASLLVVAVVGLVGALILLALVRMFFDTISRRR